MNVDGRGSKIVDDAPQLNLGSLKIHEQCDLLAGSFEIVDALSHVLITKLIHAL